MITWIDRLLITALLVIVAILTITSLPVIAGGHLGGKWLLAHMMASGAMVFALPAFGIAGMIRMLKKVQVSVLRKLGFWCLLVTGFFTIATVFFCMLPIPSTEQMHGLIFWHGVAGFATTAAAVVFLLGLVPSMAKSAKSPTTPESKPS